MNLFDLPGPQFLSLYVALGLAVCLSVWLAWRLGEGPRDVPRISDPATVALLRAGRDEAVRTAILALRERRLVRFAGTIVELGDGRDGAPPPPASLTPLDHALLAAAAKGRDVRSLAHDRGVAAVLDAAEAKLRERGVLPTAAERTRRAVIGIVAGLVLLTVAVWKIDVALSHGRRNILFLILSAAIFCAVTVVILVRRRTPAGDRLLAELRTLLGGMRARGGSPATAGGVEHALNLALLAGVFGGAALPAHAEAAKSFLWPAPQTGTSGSGCGGASCGGGSSCGGGCGGGCGGCGG